MTLLEILSAFRVLEGLQKRLPDESNKQPDQAQSPPNRIVASNALPVEDEVDRKFLAGNECSEQDQNNSGDIISKL